MTPSDHFAAELKMAMKGIKRYAARARGFAGSNLGTGKAPLSFQVYKALCLWLLEEEDGIFAHCFLTLTWNLMCRSKNTVNVHRSHITWKDDCIEVEFAHTKTDPTGDNQMRARHLHANPLHPEICCVTSLARYLAAYPSANG